MTDSFFTPAPYDPGTPDLFPETLAMQGPVNDKWYTQYGGGMAVAFTGYQKGGVTRIRFSDPCEITEIGVLSQGGVLVATGKPTYPIAKNSSKYLAFQLEIDF